MAVDRRTVLGGFAATVATSRLGRAASEVSASPTVFEARIGSLSLLPGLPTSVWSYGEGPAPVLKVKKGADVHVRLVNKLSEPTTLCWHGMRIANTMDGVAGLTQPPVASGASFDYRFTPPDSGLYWVHPHVWPQSAEQIGRGLYAVLIVEEPEPPRVDEDLLVVVDDWLLDGKGQVESGLTDIATARGIDRVGSLVTVNGSPVPIQVSARPGARLRLRLLNACGARIALVGFEGMQATVIAIDGQPSEVFQPARDMVPVGPGSRFEVMVDLPRQAGTARLVLRGQKVTDLMVIATKGDPVAPYPPVVKLPDNPLLPTRIPLERSLKRDVAIERLPDSKGSPAKPGMPPWLWALGGTPSDGVSGAPLFKVKRGGAVTLAFVNKTELPQQMHLHGHVFRLLHDLDDGWDPYWRDSVLVGPNKTKHIAFIADNPGKWVIESLMLERQVTGLAGWFEVT